MTDLLTVGRIGIDLFYKGDSINTSERDLRLTLGQKYFVSELHEGIGGGGANVAAAAVRNGISAGVLGLVGNNPFKPFIWRVCLTSLFPRELIFSSTPKVKESLLL